MTELAGALIIGLFIGFVAGWRACAGYAVREGKPKAPGQARRIGDVEPTEFSSFWDGR